MTTNERFLSVLHRITSCRHLATVNITIWNRRIEVRHTVFDEMYILRSFPLPNTHNEYCVCMAAACRCLILSRLVDTFISKISLTMLPVPKPHNTACVLSWEEARRWQSRSSGYSSS